MMPYVIIDIATLPVLINFIFVISLSGVNVFDYLLILLIYRN